MKKILIVDDNLLTLKQLEAHLSQRYEVILAKSGKIALEVCKKVVPDLILLDVRMPEMDGFETLKELQKNPSLEFIPVLFLTGSNDTMTEIKCLELGAMDFITKPANKSILLHRIELHLQFSSYQTNPADIVKDLENSIAVSFAELIEYKTGYTGRHGEDTSAFTMILGKELLRRKTFGADLTEAELEKIGRASSFHDIGKIGISDSILQKKGALTEKEFETVKQHSIIGANALSDIYRKLPGHHYFKYAAVIAKGHHERWDGTGYPEGLKGEAIPLACRIVAVANAYAACRSPRCYRPALDHRETCAVISKGKGTLFDPRIVKVFEEIEDKFDEVSKKISKGSKNEQ
ncbi:MAG: response regulator [Spirochaetaceae bacterium]|jgi:putative two-component system response regulator|nr:response regulator [Spirochaetaceae bacterium]